MKINNTNIRKPFWIVLAMLLLISVVDFILARSTGTLNTWFWGYLFIVNIVLVALVYILFGKPIFRFNEKDDILEIRSGLAINGWFEDVLYINRGNLAKFTVERKALRSYLVLSVLQKTGTMQKKFPISFLSANKRKKLISRLNDMIKDRQDPENIHLFI